MLTIACVGCGGAVDDSDSTDAALSAPLNLQASALTPTAVHLTWSPGSGAIRQYTVSRASPPGATFANIATLPAASLSYPDTSTQPGTSYAYRVAATDNKGRVAISSPVSVTTPLASCVPTTCAAQGKNCGSIPNGCGGTLICGSCAAGTVCSTNVCVVSCTPTTCAAQGKDCGNIPDGCGGTLICGSCAAGTVCSANVCAASCTPTTCAIQGKNCGSIPDGCGGTLACGSCASGQACSTNHLCTVTITASASPSGDGVTAGGGVYGVGAQVTVNATPNAGFSFANWTENGPLLNPKWVAAA
jgi:hypothetical protein